MKKTPTVSIITVTKNRADLLDRNLRSLLGQLGGPDEIIVVDNGSTDTTGRTIASYRKKLPIKAVEHPHGSFPELYNAGVSHAVGDIVAFLDDDCAAGRGFVDRIRRAHRECPNAVIQGKTESVPKGNIFAEIMGDHYRNWLQTMQTHGNRMRTFDNKNASLPRTLFLRFGGFSQAMSRGSEDIELGLRLTKAGVPIFFDPTILAYHFERTTFSGFLAQHRRIAASEGYLDRTLDPTQRLGLIARKKLFLHLKSFLVRELRYVRHGDFDKALLLPFLYGALAWIRINGYARGR